LSLVVNWRNYQLDHLLSSVINLADIENQSTNLKPPLRWLLKLSRIAFICNICFLLAFSIQVSDWIKNEDINDYIITIGFVMGFVLNPLVNICYLLVFLVARKKLSVVPTWLLVANILFLVIDAFYILNLNPRT
jgi:hypothetical protein